MFDLIKAYTGKSEFKYYFRNNLLLCLIVINMSYCNEAIRFNCWEISDIFSISSKCVVMVKNYICITKISCSQLFHAVADH